MLPAQLAKNPPTEQQIVISNSAAPTVRLATNVLAKTWMVNYKTIRVVKPKYKWPL